MRSSRPRSGQTGGTYWNTSLLLLTNLQSRPNEKTVLELQPKYQEANGGLTKGPRLSRVLSEDGAGAPAQYQQAIDGRGIFEVQINGGRIGCRECSVYTQNPGLPVN